MAAWNPEPMIGAIPVRSWPGDENLRGARAEILRSLREPPLRRPPIAPPPRVTHWDFRLAQWRTWLWAAQVRREREGKPAHASAWVLVAEELRRRLRRFW